MKGHAVSWDMQAQGEPPRELAFALDSLNVCFSTSDGLLSWWIRGYTRSPVSHALITFRDYTLDRVFVMEAGGHGFCVVPWSTWERANTLIARFRLSAPAQQQLTALRETANLLGAEYDTRGLFGFVPLLVHDVRARVRRRWRVRRQGTARPETGDEQLVAPRWRPVVRNLLDDPKRLFCSEAVARFLALAGYDDEVTRPSDWSPDNLFQFARDSGRFEQIDNDHNQPVTREKQARLPDHVWDAVEVAPPSPLRPTSG